MGIDKAKLDSIIAQYKSKAKADTEVKTAKLDSIISKYKDAESPEGKERTKTMMSIGQLNRDLMGGQLQQIGADIPDFTNKWAYDYLISEEKPSTEVDAEAQMYRNPLATEEALITDSVVVGADVQKPLRGANLQDSIKSLYDTENEDFLGSKRATASHLVDKYEADKDGFVTIGEQRMPRAQAEMIMQDVVEQTMHPTMLQKNKAYRDNWFIGNTGMNAEDYLRSIDANLASLQRELNTEVGKDIDAIRSTATALQMAENAGIDPATAQSIVTNERYGGKAIRDMRDQIQSILNNDFSSGLKEGFDVLSMISAGLNDLVANVELGNVLNKVYNDKPLTEREKIAYEAHMIGEQINELEDLFGGRSWWNEVGQGVGTSAEMAVGFAAGMGAVGKLGKFANLPVRAAIKSVRRAAKSGAWDAIKMAGIRGTQLAGRSLKNVVIAEGAGLIAAPMLPSTYASLAEKRNGQYAVENGRLVFKPTTAWRDVVDTWIESGTEIGSELIGARIGEVLGGSARAFGRMLSLDKLAAKAGIGKHSNILFGWQKPAAFKAFERSVGFQGAVAEPLSEIWGDAAANMLKGIITGNGEFAQFGDVDYWTKTLATCAIYGGSLQVASAPHAVARYANIASKGRERKMALSRIKVAKLHDEVSAALAIDNIDEAAKAFAQIDWKEYAPDQRAYAMDAIRADYAQRVAIANQVEDGRMTQFLRVADRIEDMEYRGMEGLTPKGFVKTVIDKDGTTYTALQGGKDKPLYICLDAEGNKISIPTANIVSENNIALGDMMAYQYDSMYSVESEQERQRNIVDRYNDMRKGDSSTESIKVVMDTFGIKQYRSGDDVTLVNGETATVEEFIPETGEFIVSLHNGGMETLPFYNVLSESTLTADAQKLNNASAVTANVESQLDAEERSTEAVNEPRATRFVEGDIVLTPTGEKARVREVNEDGTYEVDMNTDDVANPTTMVLENYAEADLRFEDEGVEVASTEVVPQETEVAEIEQIASESNADATMPEAKPIPQNEDGTINYDAIDDAEQFATLYEREVGGRENAAQDVADMRDSAQEDLLKSIEKGKKMRNANEKVANRREQQALAERVAFYNKVLNILTPAESVTTEEVAPTEQTSVETPSQTNEIEDKQTGLIANDLSAQLTEDFAASLDAVAKAFGLRVKFVHLASEGKANAEIEGNEVRIAWKYRGKAIPFLVGHEFTHRMQDLSPEEYNAFKGAVIKYLGEEEWNARIADVKYSYDKQRVSYTDALIEDEVVADFVGELIEEADSFDLFVAQNAKESWIKRFIEALKAIFSKLSKADVKAELYSDMLEKLNAMVAKATEVASKQKVTSGGNRKSVVGDNKFSLVGVHNISLDKLRKVIKMGGLANPSIAVIDVDKQTHDDYGEYSLVLPKNMVDARQGKNAGTWAGDAWTPTYPQIIKRLGNDKAASRFYKDIDALPEAMRSRIRLDFDGFMEGRNANALAYWYLFEKGDAPEMVIVPSRYSEDVTTVLSEVTKGSFSMYGLTPEERAKCLDVYIDVKFNGDRKAFERDLQERIKRLTETLETKKSDRVKKWAQSNIDTIKEYGFDYDAVADFIRDVEYDVRERGTINVDATITAAQDQIKENNLDSDYDAWRSNLDERYGIKEYIFDGYTNNGDRKYLPHTVENASKWMKKQGRQGSVATFPSFGVFVATVIPRMTTLESIRKRKTLLGRSKEEYDAFREKWENVYFELGKKLQPDASSFDDYGYWRLIEAVGHNNPKEFIKKEYGIELSEEDMAQLNEMLDTIRNEYPARYFETKFERPLQLSDFTAAVVPNDIPLDVESRLKDAGVKVFEYEKGNNTSRAEAMQKASAMEGVRFSLMDDAQAAAEVAPYLEAYNNDLVTFNALVNKVKDVAEKYPNATWPEKFLNENYEDENEEDFINRLKWTISNYAVEEEKEYSAEKQTIEETFGGIWIDNTQEFAKFAKAVNNTPFEENGEGIAYTDNYFYAYYRNINGEPIPYASVFMNEYESQDVVNQVNKELGNVRTSERVKKYVNSAIKRFGRIQDQNNANDGNNSGISFRGETGGLGSDILRKGRYYDNPSLYSKVKRADSGSTGRGGVRHSLITPEMDAAYLSAVERGDMATAQQMVMEAAKMAMPNTKVVDEDGNPKVVYHGTPNIFTVFNKEKQGSSTDRGIWGNGFYFSESSEYAQTYAKRKGVEGQVLSLYLNLKNPLFISLKDGGNEGAMYFHQLNEKYFTDDIFEDAAKTDAKMKVAQQKLSDNLIADGYDGVVIEYSHPTIAQEYVAFNPNQIKSADPVTYDDNGNIIPLSERFNPKKEDIRYSLPTNPFGGNSGYVGYSMSKRAATAREEGRFPKTDFKKEYNIPQATLDALVKVGVISDDEWHHTSVYGNKTTFYGWGEDGEYPELAEYYKAHKKAIDKAVKDGLDIANFVKGFQQAEMNAIEERNKAIIAAANERKKREQERKDREAYIQLNMLPVYETTKGVEVRTENSMYSSSWSAYKDGERLTKRNRRDERDEAFAEVRQKVNEIAREYDARFSLRDDLFNEYAAEVDSLKDEFSKIDPAIIDSKRLYRAHKREVIQRYANHIADVLNLPCESFAVDIDDDRQIKDAYYKYMRSHKEWATQLSVFPNYIPMREFVAMVKNRASVAAYIPESTLTLLFISETDGYDTSAKWLGTLFHENTHKIIETLGISDFEKEMVYDEAKRINPKAVAKIDSGYPNATISERGEEVIAFAIEGRLRAGEVLLDYLEGRKDIKDVLDTYKYNVPLRNQVIRRVINTLKDGYERSQNESRGVSNIENNPSNVRFRGKLADQRGDFASLRGRYDRNGREVAPRLSIREVDATEEEYKEAMLIKAQELERTLDGEKLDIVQEIADQTGWVRVDNDEWEYYGIGKVALTSTAKEEQAVLRWMQYKRAVHKARVRNMYRALINEAYEGNDTALASKYETERAEAIARIDAEYADKIEAFEKDATPFIEEYYDSERWAESKNIVNDELRKMRKKIEAIAEKERTQRIDALGKREAVAAIKTQINNLIRGDLSRYMRKRDIQAIMKAVNDSQSAYAMLQSVDNAMRTIYQLRIRKEMARMNNLTKMRIVLNETNIDPYLFLKGAIGESAARKLAENYWRGVNSSGVNVEKGVDADTAAVMQFIHDNIDYKKVKGSSEIFNVSEYISSLENKINEDVTIDAEMKTKKIEALPMIADYLEIQQMMDDFEVNYNHTRMRASNIAKLTQKIATLNKEIKALESTSDKVIASDNQLKDRQKALLKARKELRSEYRAVLSERIQNDDMYFGTMPQIVERLYQANKAIEDTLRKGRLELSLHKSREEAHKKEIINDALKDMDGYVPTTDEPVMQRVAKVALGVVTTQFHNLDYLTHEMAKYATNGEGRIWRRFAPATFAASNNIQANMRDIAKQMDDKAESLFDMSYAKMRRLAERTQIGTYPVRKFVHDGVDERGYMKGKEKVVEMPLYVCQALDILATWGQENGRQSLEKMGFDEEVIGRITRALDENNPQWREYSSWVINSLLPSRRPKLNAAHKKVFGAPMAAERNYFPIRRDKDLLHKDEDIANDGLLPLPSVVTGSVIARTNSTANIDLNVSFFDVLEENLTETEAWSEMAPIIKDLNILLSSTPVKLAMKNIREDFVTEFRKAAKVATLNYTSEYGEFDKWVVPMINKAWATSRLALKGYTSLKQLSGTLLFLPYAYDPRFRMILASRYLLGDRLPISMIVGDAEVNMKKLLEIRVDKLPIIGNVMWAMEHSVNYRNRVLSATAGNETFAKKIAEAKWHDKNWVTDVRNILDKAMNYSMLMIVGVDAFTVAGGMRAIYDYETLILNTPKEKAMLKAEFYANKTQQSAEPLFLSPMQQSRSFFAQSLSTFQNAPIAQGRIIAESLMNLIRNSSKTAMNTVNMKIEDMVAAQLQEEDAGNVMSTQQRSERAREIEKQIREIEFEKLLKDALSEVKASKKASISPLLWNAYLAPLAFNLTSILPYLIFGDDEDRKKDLVKDVFAWSWAGPFASIPVLSQLIQAAQGYDFSLSGAYDNFTEDVQRIIDHIGTKGIDWGLAGIVLDTASRRFLGIDYQTVLNIAQGIDSMIEDGYSHEALLKLINAPDSQIRLLAGERREGETVIEYTERILRLYSIGEYSKYEDYFNEKGQYIGPDNNLLKMRAYRAKRLLSEYNEAYKRNVVTRLGERGELAAMEETDAEYTNKAKSLNWSAEAAPSHTQNLIRGEYRAPVDDLTKEGYAELAGLQNAISNIAKNMKGFAGSDEVYYDMAKILDNLKQKFNSKYDEFIK